MNERINKAQSPISITIPSLNADQHVETVTPSRNIEANFNVSKNIPYQKPYSVK